MLFVIEYMELNLFPMSFRVVSVLLLTYYMMPIFLYMGSIVNNSKFMI